MSEYEMARERPDKAFALVREWMRTSNWPKAQGRISAANLALGAIIAYIEDLEAHDAEAVRLLRSAPTMIERDYHNDCWFEWGAERDAFLEGQEG